MKKCYKCNRNLPVSEFAKNARRSDGLQGQCRDCQSVYRTNHYHENKAKVLAQVNARKQELRDKIWQYKLENPCVHCGFSDPRALHLDHLGNKEYNVSELAQRGYSWERALKEIAKCQVLCANCHSIVTFERGGWKRNGVVA